MSFIFEQILTGGDRNFAYLVGCKESGAACVIDPSYSPEAVFERAEAQKLKIEYILNTHGHQDHTNGNNTMQELTGASIFAHPESFVEFDEPLKDGQELKLGNYTLQILFTPGHCPYHIVIYIPECKILITGDHLFVGKIGGTYSKEEAMLQYESLKKLYDKLPIETTIWPGHDVGCRPASTLAIEKISNPFIMAPDFEKFYELKSNWAQYKADNGLL